MSVEPVQLQVVGELETSAQTVAHPFVGQHLLLTYEGCEADLNDRDLLEAAMKAGIDASGAHIVGQAEARFEPMGFSFAFVLSESHASIHTYPEVRSAFLDIFTCGTRCQPRRFDEVLRARLKPARVKAEFLTR